MTFLAGPGCITCWVHETTPVLILSLNFNQSIFQNLSLTLTHVICFGPKFVIFFQFLCYVYIFLLINYCKSHLHCYFCFQWKRTCVTGPWRGAPD